MVNTRTAAGSAQDAPRPAVALALGQVLDGGRSLTEVGGPSGPLRALTGGDRAYALAALYGTLRWYRLLEHRLGLLLDRPIKPKDAVLKHLMCAGLHELEFLSTPAHAAINEHVGACATLGRPWARGLVNAVLRRAARSRAADAPEAKRTPLAPGIATSHPDWLVEALTSAYGTNAAHRVLDANNVPGPMTLRVDLTRLPRERYLERLRCAGIDARPGRHAPTAVVLAEPVSTASLPGFGEGLVSVQDEAAQLIAVLARGALAATTHRPLRILDACAAPGGKTLALAEAFGSDAQIAALELAPERAERIRENLVRTNRQVEVIVGDAREPGRWWDGRPFDLVLADVPCSATGVIRRHPDIKWLRRGSDVPQLVATQRAIVTALWPLLKRNGILCYATCSVLPDENDLALEAALERLTGARRKAVEEVWKQTTHACPGWGKTTSQGRRILTGEDDMDGFFYALIERRA